MLSIVCPGHARRCSPPLSRNLLPNRHPDNENLSAPLRRISLPQHCPRRAKPPIKDITPTISITSNPSSPISNHYLQYSYRSPSLIREANPFPFLKLTLSMFQPRIRTGTARRQPTASPSLQLQPTRSQHPTRLCAKNRMSNRETLRLQLVAPIYHLFWCSALLHALILGIVLTLRETAHISGCYGDHKFVLSNTPSCTAFATVNGS